VIARLFYDDDDDDDDDDDNDGDDDDDDDENDDDEDDDADAVYRLRGVLFGGVPTARRGGARTRNFSGLVLLMLRG
jgi:hypothetical protein